MDFKRLWLHTSWRLRPNPYRQHFSTSNRKKLSLCVRDAEQGHRGEIRLVVESQLPLTLILNKVNARSRARDWFSQLSIWDTEENSGILIYILLAERKIEILADRGIAAKVAPSEWEQTVKQLRQELAAEHVVEGLCRCLHQCGDLLRLHFPIDAQADNPDELSNELVFVA